MVTANGITPMSVKLLNWKAPSFRNIWTHSATTAFGTYTIERTKAHYQVILEGPGGTEREIDKPTRDLGLALAIAQYDFTKRARSLLTAATPSHDAIYMVEEEAYPEYHIPEEGWPHDTAGEDIDDYETAAELPAAPEISFAWDSEHYPFPPASYWDQRAAAE